MLFIPCMSKTNPSNLDLNLLVILDTIFSERSLTLAGNKLFMTQSAVSHALSKLRHHFDDRLFIRRGNIMEPVDSVNVGGTSVIRHNFCYLRDKTQ